MPKIGIVPSFEDVDLILLFEDVSMKIVLGLTMGWGVSSVLIGELSLLKIADLLDDEEGFNC